MKPNQQFFLVRLDKKAQEEKRNHLTRTYPYLGLRGSNHPTPDNRGVKVTVEAGSPAAAAGFGDGDVILQVGETPVNSMTELAEAVGRHRPGDELRLHYFSRLSIGAKGIPAAQCRAVRLASKELKLHLSQVKEMEYNLQYGTIVEIGSAARAAFPEAEAGDVLLFHHTVEYKPRTEGDKLYNDYHLVGAAGEDELRVVDIGHEVFGVLKVAEARIIPYERYIFCHHNIRKASFQHKGGIWMPDAWEKTTQQMADDLEELGRQIQSLAASDIMAGKPTEANYRRREQIEARIAAINKERAAISKRMNGKRLVEVTVLFFNPRTADHVGSVLSAGDKIVCDMHTLYPLEIGGVLYSLARVGYIDALAL